jgi:hypothetical protein
MTQSMNMKSSADIVGAYLGRPQSPGVEVVMQELIYDALKELLEGSYLYRTKRLDLARIIAKADDKFNAKALEEEFTYRPWIPHSLNRGFTANERMIHSHASGCDPIGTPPREMHLTFIIPTVETWCSKCGEASLHDSIPHIDCSPYHLNPEAIKEPSGFRTFLFNYQCHKCKSPPLTFMVRRELLKLQLCGRSQPYFPPVPSQIPKSVRHIYTDCVQAVACGDLAGGFYHLRTLLEHHMKAACGVPLNQQILGDDLCATYNKLTDPVVVERAALTEVFQKCSANLHGRTGTDEEFESFLERLEMHFKLAETLRTLKPTK